MAASLPPAYTDIGHAGPSVRWLIDGDRLYRFREGTHEEVWGAKMALACWRGRHEPDTGIASIAAPQGWTGPPSRRVLRMVRKALAPNVVWYFPWPPGSPAEVVCVSDSGMNKRR